MATLKDNLTAYWSLEEASGTRNDAHGTNHLAVTGSVPGVTGKVGNAADFEGSANNALTLADNAALSLGTDTAFTWVFWFWPESLTGQIFRPVVAKTAGSLAFEYDVAYDVTNQRWQLEVSNGTASGIVTLAYADTGISVWHFLAAWHDPISDKLFLQLDDGTPAETAWAGGTQDGTNSFNMGRFPHSTGLRWDGLLDEVGFWKRVLSPQERSYLYNSGSGRNYAALGAGITIADLPTVTFSAPAVSVFIGTAGNANATLATVQVSAPALSVTIIPDAQATASLPAVVVSAPGVQASVGSLALVFPWLPVYVLTVRAVASGDAAVLVDLPVVLALAPEAIGWQYSQRSGNNAHALLRAGLEILDVQYGEFVVFDHYPLRIFRGLIEEIEYSNAIELMGPVATQDAVLHLPTPQFETLPGFEILPGMRLSVRGLTRAPRNFVVESVRSNREKHSLGLRIAYPKQAEVAA